MKIIALLLSAFGLFAQEPPEWLLSAATKSATRSNYLLDGLIAYYKLDEANATDNAVDSHINAIDLLQSSTPSVSSGLLNNCRAAHTRYFTNSSSLFKTGVNGLTVSLWVYCTNAAGATAVDGIVSKYNTGTTYSWAVFQDSGSRFRFYCSSNSSNSDIVIATNVIQAGAWYHIVCRYDHANSKQSIRVTPQTESVPCPMNETNHVAGLYPSDWFFSIGALWISGSYRSLAGRIDECGVWSTNLTDRQVTNLFNGGAPLPYASFD